MADSAVAVTAGTGTNIDTRTEGTNGNHRQVIIIGDPATNAGVAPVDATAGLKVDLGADNDVVVTNAGTFATQATLQAGSAAIGKLAANSGVDIGDVDVTSSALPTGASTSAKQDTQITAEQAIQTSVEVIDNLVQADDADFTATSTVAVPVMGVYESTPTTVTDGDLGTVGITSGRRMKTSATIDAALPAGTNAIGKLAANSGVDIGDVTIDNATLAVTQSGTWDEVGINDSGNSITVDYATTGSGTATGALRVELPTNGTGVIATVGAVTAITNALPAGTNAIGKLAANSGVDIGDVDVTSISAGDNNIGNVDVVTLPALAAGTNAVGKLLPPDIDVTAHTNYARKYYTNAGAVTDGIVWSPAAGKRWHVTTLYINISAAATITVEDDKAGGDDPVWKGELAANSGVVLTFPSMYPMASGEDAADLLITTSAGNVYVTAVGYEI